MHRTRRTTTAAAVVLGVVMLTGCSALPAAPASPSPSLVPPARPLGVPEPAPTESEPAAPATEDDPEIYFTVDDGRASVPERGGDGCEGLPSLEPRNDDDDRRVHGYWYSELRDLGPRPQATGEATVDDAGLPVAYRAAEGDVLAAVAERFCIDHYPYLEWINAIRRGSASSMHDLGQGAMPLYAGDTINLDPFTIATVGDENGRVRANEIDFHIPPQR
ncbi:hypothetical protein C8046_01170 [Serinibacter arcticus]|uniref:LysM domain-containing protein n=1 Tax=Serinibacter arcticus TaxID=1655435 RepID=A0A2U1ZRI5_9MICO|nr:hypothetical protein [Serinibacter arcticus]PWD49532.1 hypothetical protein C8046_01170 [Serinibacter arcticus]